MIMLLQMLERNLQKWQYVDKRVQLTKGKSERGRPLMVFREEGKEFYFAVEMSGIKAALRAFDDQGKTATEGGES